MNKAFFEKTSYLSRQNSEYVEYLFEKYLEDPNSVEDSWKEFFYSIGDNIEEVRNFSKGAHWNKKSKANFEVISGLGNNNKKEIKKPETLIIDNSNLSSKLEKFINSYRINAHFLAKLDPLNLEKLPTEKDLGLDYKDFFLPEELDNEVILSNNINGKNKGKIKDLLNELFSIYNDNVGIDFNHIYSQEKRDWLVSEFEQLIPSKIDNNKKINILNSILKFETFEQFLHIKFSGAKRFSIEGLESSLMALQTIIDESVNYNMDYCAIGMAHRGRLNVLTSIMSKPYEAVLAEFRGIITNSEELNISGDVKYHMGYSRDKITENGKVIHLSLLPNPSHLEAVNSLVAGKIRCHQDSNKDTNREKSFGILLHGDAAFAGQGIVYESLMLNELESYNTGGIIHIITNNQIGFTTNHKNARSSRYPTDIAKAISCPIIHVNADDLEAVYKVATLALKYRAKFKQDIVLNIVGYRKYGHNEGDEPLFTQPIMYEIIKKHISASQKYAKFLEEKKIYSEENKNALVNDFKNTLEIAYENSLNYKVNPDWLKKPWDNQVGDQSKQKNYNTGINKALLKELINKLITLPEDFNLNKKIERLFNQKKDLIEKDETFDWATAESLAFATLLIEEYGIRFTGQDVERGTFSHRHAVLTDQINENRYIPLNNLSHNQANLEIYNSNLSEYAVLGFEYGYSISNPNYLTIWEAQFGDFANGAQIIIDQYIASGETKWLRMSGLVLLLPHGFEGQGPEHSSARLERFLQLCANDNIQVANCTTPASYFHILRRQIHRNYRKPLIIMSPKSLLRNKYVISKLDEIDNNTNFQPLLDDYNLEIQNIDTIVFMTGKIFYDLHDYREKNGINNNVALIRLEELYPFAEKGITEILKKYNKVQKVIWCQEEPQNMGAWNFIYPRMRNILKGLNLSEIEYVGRVENASPATGYASVHNKEQEEIIKKIFIN